MEAPNYRLIDIYDLEQRLVGHLDALVLAGEAGLTIAQAEAAEGGQNAAAVFVHVALRQRRKELLNVMEFPEDDRRSFCCRLAEAAAWCAQEDLAEVMSQWMGSSTPFQAVALEICRIHRVDPRQHLDARIGDFDPDVQACAIRLAGELGRLDCLAALREVGGDDADLAAVRLGDKKAPERLHDASGFPRDSEMARSFAETFPQALRRDEAIEAIRGLLAIPGTRRWGTIAIGALGWADGLPSLLNAMAEPLYARPAVSAFEQITGLYVAHEDLEMDEFPEDPEGPDLGSVEEFIDTNTPWPDLMKFETWIAGNQQRFTNDERLLLGVNAWTFGGVPEPWVKYQARYRWIATTQALRQPDAPLPNHRSPVHIDGRHFTRRW
ncbi:MAG: hypothetical protein AAF557_03080 [Pseudomonadota bacterium]